MAGRQLARGWGGWVETALVLHAALLVKCGTKAGVSGNHSGGKGWHEECIEEGTMHRVVAGVRRRGG